MKPRNKKTEAVDWSLGWEEIAIVNGSGGYIFRVCPTCSALVRNPLEHETAMHREEPQP